MTHLKGQEISQGGHSQKIETPRSDSLDRWGEGNLPNYMISLLRISYPHLGITLCQMPFVQHWLVPP